jgi:catechol 2,3-dioxygenase-like lactoylglutathione lyase family enzyme
MNSGVAAQLVRISRNVADLDCSVAFYVHRLGFTEAPCGSALDHQLGPLAGFPQLALKTQRLTYGAQEIELVEVGAEAAAYPADSNSADIWFQHFALRCSDIAATCRQLHRDDLPAPLPVAISRDSTGTAAPITLPVRSGGATAFKFRDPDGHPLELIQFNADGEQHAVKGIDHSAISVADARRSIDFYTGVFGMQIGHRQTNFGTEQQNLDALAEDRVDVIAMMPNGDSTSCASPHIELLAYQSPTGRAMSGCTTPLDIASDRLVFKVENLQAIVDACKQYLSAISIDSKTGHGLMRDPDGHFLLLLE